MWKIMSLIYSLVFAILFFSLPSAISWQTAALISKQGSFRLTSAFSTAKMIRAPLFSSTSFMLIDHALHNLKLVLVWGNYKSDGKKEAKYLLGVASLLVLKLTFTSVNIRTTYVCPSGPRAETILKSLVD